jgi:two-component system CheB/CheR fusion protein
MADRKSKNVNTAMGQGASGADIFPVIGIGASAGGLEAFRELFEKMPADTGAAYVIVQHLAPSKKSAMPDLLARYSAMPANQITDNLEIKPNRIYLIPPNKNLAILNGAFQLLPLLENLDIHHPIDFFFKSLASDRRGNAIGIVLSGTGSDGTEGARAIKAELGLIIVQDPEEAKYDGMPRSVINAGLADYVLAAADIPARAIQYMQHIPEVITAVRESPNGIGGLLPKIVALVRNETGNDFAAYKESTLLRRIKRRMAIHQINEASRYVRFLQQNPKEISTLFKEFLINVTSFFRDKEAFETLKAALKDRLEHLPPQEEIRAWVVGCATGEEAYSIAIIIREILNELGIERNAQVFGTDLDADAIEIARNGVYRTNIADDITPERLWRFFTRRDDFYQINSEIREMLVFAVHNLAKEPPFLRTDLISARNLLIYLKGDLQKKLIPLFHYSLLDNGILFLSPSETVGEFTDLFANMNRKWKIYQRRPSVKSGGRLPLFPLQPFRAAQEGYHSRGNESIGMDIAQAADKMLLSDYAPPCVVIDNADNIVYVRGDTDKYLKLPEGKATMNIVEMARRGLASHLSMAIRSARRNKAEARRQARKVDSPGISSVDILVKSAPLQGQSHEYLMVIFKESPPGEASPVDVKAGKIRKRGRLSEKDRYIEEMEQELKHSKEDVQATIEELETSNEELKSANEELLSSNEELQSTNEELETSREELRSVNEELSGLNTENQERIDQLYSAQDDMRNLLNSISVATVFVDPDLNIKRYTPAATEFFSIRESDIGRPISEISCTLEYGSLQEDILKVLRTLAKVEREVKTKDGRWYSLRIMPYKNREEIISGALLTIFDIDEQRIVEAALHYTQNIVDTVREPMLVLDSELRVLWANRSFYQVFRTAEEETKGRCIYELGNRQWNIPELKRLLEEIIPQNSHFNNYPVEHDFPVIGPCRMLLNARRLYDELGSQKILLAIEDVTDKPWMKQLFSETQPEQKRK